MAGQTLVRLGLGLVVAACVPAAWAQGAGSGGAGGGSAGMSERATFLFGNERWHDEPEVGWKGFLSGLRGFEHFYHPVGQPLFFETPFNFTGARAIFLHHRFSDDSQLGGGEVNVAALQVRVALTERLGLIATKTGTRG